MKISIVTVAYDSAATIGYTLDSVARQSHPQIEHIVVDGASRDDTLAVVRTRGAHVARMLSEPDRGIYDAMNKGLALATGDFVGFLNADDMLASPGTVATIARAAAAPEVGAVCGDLVYVRADQPEQVLRYWRTGPFSPARLRYGWMPPHPTFYVRRTLLQHLGDFDTQLRIAADYDFMLRCLRLPGMQVCYVPEVMVRMRAGGASNRSLRALLRKSSEDLDALRRNQVGGMFTLLCKNLRKLPQFFSHSRPA
jgi:glycosyltransferase